MTEPGDQAKTTEVRDREANCT